MTNLTTADICKMTAEITGTDIKRAATKEAAIVRLRKIAEEYGVDADAILSGAAVGQPAPKPVAAPSRRRAALDLIEAEAPAQPPRKPKDRVERTGTKKAALIEMLKSSTGATLQEIVAATGWQPHTVRGAIAGSIKKMGYLVKTEAVGNRGRVYKIA